MNATTIQLIIHYPPADMPDADTDCIAFVAGEEEGQLAALIGEDDDGAPIWVGAVGERLGAVDAWCEMPVRAVRTAPEAATLETKDGKSVGLSKPWAMPC